MSKIQKYRNDTVYSENNNKFTPTNEYKPVKTNKRIFNETKDAYETIEIITNLALEVENETSLIQELINKNKEKIRL